MSIRHIRGYWGPKCQCFLFFWFWILRCKDPFESDFVTVGLVIIGVGLNNCHQSLRWAKQTSFGLNLLRWKASLLLLEKRKPSTNAAMQGVQKMQQAIVCWMRRKMRGRRRRRTRRWSTGRRRRSTWWRWEESREGGGVQCSPNLLLWISSSAVHLSQPVCPLPSCCFG